MIKLYYITSYGAKALIDAKYVEIRDVSEVKCHDGKWEFKDGEEI